MVARADLRDGRSSAGRERPKFCSRVRRVREGRPAVKNDGLGKL